MQNKKDRLRRFLADPNGYIGWGLTDRVLAGINIFFSTLWCRMTARLWGVQLGRGVRFHGLTRFKRYPNSVIRIGDGTSLLSSLTANPVGLFRPCMLTTWHAAGASINIGRNCGLSGVSITAYRSVTIGNNVLIGPQTIIADTDGHGQQDRSDFEGIPVVIEDDVWIGVNCVILKGVTIGQGTVVAANSMVTRSLPPHVLAAGTPARVIRSLDQ